MTHISVLHGIFDPCWTLCIFRSWWIWWQWALEAVAYAVALINSGLRRLEQNCQQAIQRGQPLPIINRRV